MVVVVEDHPPTGHEVLAIKIMHLEGLSNMAMDACYHPPNNNQRYL